MTDRQMITTPALNAMSGHGLTDARVIVMSDAELYPERQGQSVTGRAVAYSVFCPATERFSLVTLDGRWIIPGREGYKTRGPIKSFARKKITDVRPDGLVILEPVRHNGRYAAGSYGQRKAGICRRQIHRATRGGYGYECSCGAVLNPSDVSRDGFTIVSDGRSGTHDVAYAVRSEHGIEWSTDVVMRHDAPVVAATPFRPAAEVIAKGQERKAESVPVASAPAESAPDAPTEADAPFVGPYGVRERKIPSGIPGVGVRPSRWDVVDANGRVASTDHMSALAANVRADFLNGEHGQGQTPETAPEGTPDNARRWVTSGATGRAYVTGNGARMRIESKDSRCAFTLRTVPDEAGDEAKDGFAATAREFADVIRNRAQSPAVFKPARVQMWSGRPAPRKAFEPKDYAPGSMLAWVVEGVRYTGQVWATRVQGGDWNRNHSSYNPGEATAVIVATVDGRRARRDEAVAVPLYTGSRRKTAYAHVAFPMGPMDSDGRVPRWQADVTLIAPECASDGLFDVVTPRVDDMGMWEDEGGAFVREYDDAPDAPAVDAPAPAADAPAESERVVGAHCHSCQEDGLVIAGTCRRCGRVDIVAAMTASGPRMCPAEEKARATGRLYCPRCFRTGVALYASMYWTADGEGRRFHLCADCYGRRVPSAQPVDVKAPAGATVRAARKAREFAERHGCSVGDQFRAAEAARLRAAQEFGARAGDVISDPCGEAAWEGEGGAVPGVATPPPAPEGEPSDRDATPDAPPSNPGAAKTPAVKHRAPDELGAGDVVTLAGRKETVRGVTAQGEWVHVYVINDGGDPYLVRPYDTVSVHPNSGGLDACASSEATPSGEGEISPELDAYASKKDTAAPPANAAKRTRYHVGMHEIGLDPIYRVECLAVLDSARVWLTADIENTAEDVEDDSEFDACLGKLACTPDAELVGEHPIDAYTFWVRAVVDCGCPCDCAETGRADECDGEHNREAAPEPQPHAEGRSAPDGAAPDVISDPGAVDAWESDGGVCLGVETPRGPEYGRALARMRSDHWAIDAVWDLELIHRTVPVSLGLRDEARRVTRDAARAVGRAELEKETRARITLADRVADARRVVEGYGAHLVEAAAKHARWEAERRAAAVRVDVVSDPGAVDAWESDGGACVGVETPRGPESGPAGGAEDVPAPRTPGGGTSAVPAPLREARRRAEEAESKAEVLRRRAEQVQEAASGQYGRFAGGQPILMGHKSARGALRDRARGDAATRRAIEAAAEADRAESAARKARQAAELAEVVHGRSRPWERADFQRGDVVEVRKIYTDTYVVVRANAKTLTLRNAHGLDDTKARYDQVLSRRRDGRTVTDPGQLDAPPAPSGERGAVTTEVEVPAPGGVGGISSELDACTPKEEASAPAPDPTGAPGAADASAGTPWAPAPDGERWDFAQVRQALTRRGLTAGDFGGPDGWHLGPDMWDVMITRVQTGSPFRPRGQARETWDAALRLYAEAVETAGATVVRRNHHCVVVRVPVPAELRTIARARRVGELDDFATAVTFDGRDGIGGTVSLRSAGAGAATYEVRDHTGHTIDAAQSDRRAATASLAHWYGLPTPAEYVEEGRQAEVPAESGELDACAPSASVPSSAPDVISDPGAVDAWESDGGACPGVETPRGPESGPAGGAEGVPAPHTPGGGTAAPGPTEETEEALTAAAGHPALVECQTAAELLTAHADAHPDDETAQGWAFEAVERVDLCAWAIEEGDDEAAAEHARAAKGERAAVTLGQLDEAGPMTPERLAALDADTLALLRWYAGPWPVRWLWPPETDRPRVINLFHGPGGWSVGVRDVLGADVDMVGVDLDPGAVATATAAGFEVIHASVTDLDPECPALRWVVGIILSPPCQAFSPAGLRMGRYASAIALIVSVIRGVGAAAGYFAWVDGEGRDAGSAPRSGESWEDVRAPLAELDDPRAGLMAEVVLWPLAMLARGGAAEWVAVEQSSALPAEIEAALKAEFVQAGWGTVEAETLDAVRYGAASHRRRRFLTAYRTAAPFVSLHPVEAFPVTTFGECAGWARGRMVNTRGQRGIDPKTGRPKGGNTFPADRPSGCITATAYGWKDDESGEKIGQATIGRLVGFPGDYPWQHVGRGAGIRNKAQQAADAVCPMVGAAIIGRALGVEWELRARAYADALYRPAARPAAPLVATLPRPRSAEPVTSGATAAASTVPADPPGVMSAAVAAPAGAPVPRPLSRRMWDGGPGVSAQVTARDRGPRDNPPDRATRQPAGSRAGSRGPPRRGPAGRWVGGRSVPKT